MLSVLAFQSLETQRFKKAPGMLAALMLIELKMSTNALQNVRPRSVVVALVKIISNSNAMEIHAQVDRVVLIVDSYVRVLAVIFPMIRHNFLRQSRNRLHQNHLNHLLLLH